MVLLCKTTRGCFKISSFSDQKGDHYQLAIESEAQKTPLKQYDNPLDAIDDVITQKTGFKAWDESNSEDIPKEAYDIKHWSKPPFPVE